MSRWKCIVEEPQISYSPCHMHLGTCCYECAERPTCQNVGLCEMSPTNCMQSWLMIDKETPAMERKMYWVVDDYWQGDIEGVMWAGYEEEEAENFIDELMIKTNGDRFRYTKMEITTVNGSIKDRRGICY